MKKRSNERVLEELHMEVLESEKEKFALEKEKLTLEIEILRLKRVKYKVEAEEAEEKRKKRQQGGRKLRGVHAPHHIRSARPHPSHRETERFFLSGSGSGRPSRKNPPLA